ncbi:MAG: phosphoadenosine phosphosulfate reductase [Paracoccaceae bacterium]
MRADEADPEAGFDDLRSLSDAAWAERIAKIGDEAGAFERLGPAHAAFFADEGTTLLVTFETRDGIRKASPEQLPAGFAITRPRGWSLLTLIATGPTWFRDPAVFGYFDRLVDDAFFEDFDRVVFYGAGMCGYAAAAFSVTAPGATVVLIQPQATLDPLVAGWDPRFAEKRRIDFTTRYGFAPDMTEGAGPVFVIYDPEQQLDAMHAALFRRPWATLLPCRNLGRDVAGALDGMRVLPSLLTAACTGALDAALFRAFYRARRNYPPYLRNLVGKLDADGRPLLNALLCRNVVQRLNGPKFRARLADLETQLKQAGVTLPLSKAEGRPHRRG